MATKYYEIEGELVWANNLFMPEANPNFPGTPAYYKCNLIVDLENRDIFKDSGVRTRINNTDDGRFRVLLKRPAEHKRAADGTLFGGGRPAVMDAEGAEWPDKKIIGNGSRARVRYVTYTAGAFSGHRLESVTILHHVPYENEKREASEEPAVENKKKEKTPSVPF